MSATPAATSSACKRETAELDQVAEGRLSDRVEDADELGGVDPYLPRLATLLLDEVENSGARAK